MRLTPAQQAAIRSTVTETFGDAARVWLFGSRVDDDKRGGDIDLLIETKQSDVAVIVRAELDFLAKVKTKLGEQQIDLLIDYPTRQFTPPIFAIARQTGIPL
ncbi:MAG: nucleotidyltransferase domain-containing protein [Pseudomonadota bacterium]|nr:nucleotidyltransferase domain-containing protein [Pseudomonadota bacterium]